jgi:hypothetical protein
LIRVPICTPPFSFDAWILRPPPPLPHKRFTNPWINLCE